MRRRASKLLACIKAASFEYSIQQQQSSPEGPASDLLISMLHTMQQAAESGDTAGELEIGWCKT